MHVLAFDPIEPTRQEMRQAEEAARHLSNGSLTVSHLPDVARQLLSQILAEIASGHALSIVPFESDLNVTQAARLLNVSRPYVMRLLEEGRLPFHQAGTERHIRLHDVLTYRDRQDRESEAALAELTAQAEELGMGY